MNTATINVRLNRELKESAYSALNELNITPSEAVRLCFEYIAHNKKLPVKEIVVSTEDMDLLEVVKERLSNPEQAIRVNVNDL